jgi:hypothetical protein
MQTPIVFGVCVGVALAAVHSRWRRIVWYTFNVRVTVSAVEITVNGTAELFVVDVLFWLFTIKCLGHTRGAMACQAVGIRQLAIRRVALRECGPAR